MKDPTRRGGCEKSEARRYCRSTTQVFMRPAAGLLGYAAAISTPVPRAHNRSQNPPNRSFLLASLCSLCATVDGASQLITQTVGWFMCTNDARHTHTSRSTGLGRTARVLFAVQGRIGTAFSPLPPHASRCGADTLQAFAANGGPPLTQDTVVRLLVCSATLRRCGTVPAPLRRHLVGGCGGWKCGSGRVSRVPTCLVLLFDRSARLPRTWAAGAGSSLVANST